MSYSPAVRFERKHVEIERQVGHTAPLNAIHKISYENCLQVRRSIVNGTKFLRAGRCRGKRSMRHRLSDSQSIEPGSMRSANFLRPLDDIGVAAALLDRRGDLVDINFLASRMIFGDAAPAGRSAAVIFSSRTVQSVLSETFGIVELEQPCTPRRLAFQAVDVHLDQEPYRLMLLLDLAARPPVAGSALEKIFGLTAAESRLAAELSSGLPIAAIARSRRVSIPTLRTQLTSIFGKTGTSRQPELVALLARVCQFSHSFD